MAWLALVRHGESECNALGKWTGKTDVSLTDKGKSEAQQAGEALCQLGVPIESVYTSSLKRANETYDEMKKELKSDVEQVKNVALDERDYGIFTGKNKWDVQHEIGEEQFQNIRRGWDTTIPEGESLEQVYARVVPYYKEHILPDLLAGKNVLVVAHGNSLRALVKYLESLDNTEVEKVELGTGEVCCYNIDDKATVCDKRILQSGKPA